MLCGGPPNTAHTCARATSWYSCNKPRRASPSADPLRSRGIFLARSHRWATGNKKLFMNRAIAPRGVSLMFAIPPVPGGHLTDSPNKIVTPVVDNNGRASEAVKRLPLLRCAALAGWIADAFEVDSSRSTDGHCATPGCRAGRGGLLQRPPRPCCWNGCSHSFPKAPCVFSNPRP